MRHVDLTKFVLPGEPSPRFIRADIPPDEGIPFALIHLADASPVRMDLDKRVFLDRVADEALAKAASPLADYIFSRQPEPTALPSLALEIIIRQAAEKFSLIRKAERIFWEYQQKLDHLKTSSSSPEEMLQDWVEGAAFVSLRIIENDGIRITDLNPESFRYLEESWLKDVKQLKAYYLWKTDRIDDQEQNYAKASQTIRDLLVNGSQSPVKEFQKIKDYLETRYLEPKTRRLDDSKSWINMMIARKAERIWQMALASRDPVDSNANWFRARLYVSLYYENIIGAVVDSDKEKTLNILRAFQFSKSPRNRYLIINAFEAAIAIAFLNKDIVREVLATPELYTFNLEPVRAWPSDIQTDHLRYNSADSEIEYIGVMAYAEKERLKVLLREESQKDAIERLFLQSQLRPFEAQVL